MKDCHSPWSSTIVFYFAKSLALPHSFYRRTWIRIFHLPFVTSLVCCKQKKKKCLKIKTLYVIPCSTGYILCCQKHLLGPSWLFHIKILDPHWLFHAKINLIIHSSFDSLIYIFETEKVTKHIILLSGLSKYFMWCSLN